MNEDDLSKPGSGYFSRETLAAAEVANIFLKLGPGSRMPDNMCEKLHIAGNAILKMQAELDRLETYEGDEGRRALKLEIQLAKAEEIIASILNCHLGQYAPALHERALDYFKKYDQKILKRYNQK